MIPFDLIIQSKIFKVMVSKMIEADAELMSVD